MAVLSTGIGLVAVVSFVTGLILETVTIGRRVIKQLRYSSISVLPI
jgi:hypothetical protein